MTSPHPTALALCAAALAAVLGALGLPSAALADDAPGDAVSWSVSPADETGEDGRFSIEHELEPGESVEEHIIVRNLGAGDVVFALSAADGFTTEAGRFDMLPSGQQSTDAGSWISIPSDVEVPAGGSAVVPFTITVPANAEPGDHAAGVAASVLSVRTDANGGAGVGVESRVGVKVITRVAGEITPAFAVTGLRADYRLDWNPLEPGAVTVSFDVRNTGNTRLDAAGSVSIGGHEIRFPADGERRQVLLPGESRSFTVQVPEVWPLFLLGGELTVAPSAAALDGAELAVAASTASLIVWAVPWPQLLLIAGAVLIVLALRGGRIRSRRRMDALISEAVERGREEALQASRGERVAG